jgi:alpha-methylacyl-CoA racemase
MTLKSIKVLDFTHLLPGEVASTLLCDMGAEVLRVERLVPTLNELLPPLVKGESLYFWSLHRNKKRIKLDLKQAAAVSAVHELVKNADVVIENFRPNVMPRLGLGAETLMAINPRLIFCSISGYGASSKWCDKPGHDLNFIAESGVLGESLDEKGKPIMPGVFVSDYMSGIYAALSIVSALFEREQSGAGKRIEISMFESSLSALSVAATMRLYEGLDKTTAETKYPDDLPNHRVYRCKDSRYLAVAPIEPVFWQRFLELIERSELLGRDVIKERFDLSAAIADTIATKTLAQWLVIFADSDCCVSPVNTIEEAVAYLPEGTDAVLSYMHHERLGAVPQIISPLRKNRIKEEKALPDWSCHDTTGETHAKLAEIGLTSAQIEAMQKAGIIR